MKKVALSVLALLAVGSMAFAAGPAIAFPATATVTGEGSVTLGYDLDTGYYGFANAASADVSLSFLTDASVSKGEQGGTITIGNIDISAANGGVWTIDADDAVAKIVFGDLALKIAGTINPSVDYAGSTEFTADALYGGVGITIASMAVAIDPQASIGGLEAVYTIKDVAAITIALANLLNYTSTTGDQAFEFAAGVDVTAVKNLTLGATFTGATGASAAMGLGAKVGYDATIVNVQAKVDFDLAGDYGVILDVTAPVIKGLTIASATGLGSDNVIAEGIKLSLTKDLLMVADLSVIYGLYDITDIAADRLYVSLTGLAAGPATLYANFTKIADTTLNARVGAELAGLIENVKFNVDYSTKNLADDEMGVVTVKATVAF